MRKRTLELAKGTDAGAFGSNGWSVRLRNLGKLGEFQLSSLSSTGLGTLQVHTCGNTCGQLSHSGDNNPRRHRGRDA